MERELSKLKKELSDYKEEYEKIIKKSEIARQEVQRLKNEK